MFSIFLILNNLSFKASRLHDPHTKKTKIILKNVNHIKPSPFIIKKKLI